MFAEWGRRTPPCREGRGRSARWHAPALTIAHDNGMQLGPVVLLEVLGRVQLLNYLQAGGGSALSTWPGCNLHTQPLTILAIGLSNPLPLSMSTPFPFWLRPVA